MVKKTEKVSKVVKPLEPVKQKNDLQIPINKEPAKQKTFGELITTDDYHARFKKVNRDFLPIVERKK
jgi:hypothetical protein